MSKIDDIMRQYRLEQAEITHRQQRRDIIPFGVMLSAFAVDRMKVNSIIGRRLQFGYTIGACLFTMKWCVMEAFGSNSSKR